MQKKNYTQFIERPCLNKTKSTKQNYVQEKQPGTKD